MRLLAFLDPDDVPVVGALDERTTVEPLGVGLRSLIDDGSSADLGRFASRGRRPSRSAQDPARRVDPAPPIRSPARSSASA